MLALRGVLWLQLPPNGSGSLVFKIDPLAPAADTLEINDVVLEIEGVPIADDGTVEFRNEERVEFSHIVRSKHIGGLSGQLLGAASTPLKRNASLQNWQHNATLSVRDTGFKIRFSFG